MSFLMQAAKTVWWGRAAYFWPTWITITVVSAICVAWIVGRAETPIGYKPEKTSTAGTSRAGWSRGAVAALTLLGLFLVAYIVLALIWENFTYSDNSMFTLHILRGHDLAPPIWSTNGRFFPLGHQEFNILRHFTLTAIGYHLLPIAQLLLLSGVLLILDGELNVTARACLTTFVLITPGILVCFTGLIYPDRNVIFWLACLVLFVKRFEETQYTAWAVAAAVCAQIMIYYKETAFLLLLGFAIGRLILRCWDRNRPRLDFSRLREKESRLDLCLAFLGLIFLLYFAAVMFPHWNMQYANEYRVPLTKIIFDYIKMDMLAWLFVAVVLGRTYLILGHRVKPLPLWDGLALGGLACFTSYIYLRMFSAYYLAPVDLIAVLYLGRLVILSWGLRGVTSKAAIMVLLCAVLLQDVSLSTFRMFERKNVIHGKAEIARAIQTELQDGAGNEQRVFFPFASPYRVMEFASYLNYLGVSLEGLRLRSAEPRGVVLISKAAHKDGPCVGYEHIVCHAGSRPEPGDLVIVLPDDDASLAKVAPYRDGGGVLFSYEPHPRIPRWLYPLVRHLHVASYAFAQKKLPDRWLNGSVTLWK